MYGLAMMMVVSSSTLVRNIDKLVMINFFLLLVILLESRSPIFCQFTYLQLNKYETAPYFLQLSQKLTLDCLLISVYLHVFTSFCIMCSQNCSAAHIMQKLVKTDKYTEINKQCHVKFWLN